MTTNSVCFGDVIDNTVSLNTAYFVLNLLITSIKAKCLFNLFLKWVCV
jgi:hypothetical protein